MKDILKKEKQKKNIGKEKYSRLPDDGTRSLDFQFGFPSFSPLVGPPARHRAAGVVFIFN